MFGMHLFKKFFRGPVHAGIGRELLGQDMSKELRHATAALLIEAAKSNGVLPEIQVLTIKDILRDQFDFSHAEVVLCIDDAAQKLETGERIEEIAGAIRENFSVEQRVIVLALVWRVVLCDGGFDKFERKMLYSIQFHLGLNDEQLEEARIMAEHHKV